MPWTVAASIAWALERLSPFLRDHVKRRADSRLSSEGDSAEKSGTRPRKPVLKRVFRIRGDLQNADRCLLVRGLAVSRPEEGAS